MKYKKIGVHYESSDGKTSFTGVYNTTGVF